MCRPTVPTSNLGCLSREPKRHANLFLVAAPYCGTNLLIHTKHGEQRCFGELLGTCS